MNAPVKSSTTEGFILICRRTGHSSFVSIRNKMQTLKFFTLFWLGLLLCLAGNRNCIAAEKQSQQKLLYVAVPGIRDYLEYGGHGILVFDIENGHKFVKRVPSAGVDEKGRPL